MYVVGVLKSGSIISCDPKLGYGTVAKDCGVALAGAANKGMPSRSRKSAVVPTRMMLAKVVPGVFGNTADDGRNVEIRSNAIRKLARTEVRPSWNGSQATPIAGPKLFQSLL